MLWEFRALGLLFEGGRFQVDEAKEPVAMLLAFRSKASSERSERDSGQFGWT